jgi:hypothetical protein
MKFIRKVIFVVLLILILAACSSTAAGQPAIPLVDGSIPATLTPIPLPTPTSTLPPTADPSTFPTSCMDTQMANDIVEGWLQHKGYPTLKAAWEVFKETYGEEVLSSSTTDYNDQYALAVTWQKMLLVGEYPFQINLPDRNGIGYCSVLIYQGGLRPEVSLGITDAALGGEWSGYASGLVKTEQDTRQFLADRIGKAVTVRYMVAQTPEDNGFERPGFYSPVMQQLWTNSYYTRIPNELNILQGMAGQPLGPSIREMMGIAGALHGYGVFMEYIVDAVPVHL